VADHNRRQALYGTPISPATPIGRDRTSIRGPPIGSDGPSGNSLDSLIWCKFLPGGCCQASTGETAEMFAAYHRLAGLRETRLRHTGRRADPHVTAKTAFHIQARIGDPTRMSLPDTFFHESLPGTAAALLSRHDSRRPSPHITARPELEPDNGWPDRRILIELNLDQFAAPVRASSRVFRPHQVPWHPSEGSRHNTKYGPASRAGPDGRPAAGPPPRARNGYSRLFHTSWSRSGSQGNY